MEWHGSKQKHNFGLCVNHVIVISLCLRYVVYPLNNGHINIIPPDPDIVLSAFGYDSTRRLDAVLAELFLWNGWRSWTSWQ